MEERKTSLQDVKKKIPAIQRQLNGGQKKIVVIDGPSGPTGKTTAARILADAGIPVYEEYQVIRITMDEPLSKVSGEITIDMHLNGLTEQLAKAHELVETIEKARSLADDLAKGINSIELEL